MHSIRTKFTMLTTCVAIISLSVITMIGAITTKNLGRNDADEMLHLTATTGAMNLESYFESVEHSVQTVSTLVQDSFDGMSLENLEAQVERTRKLYDRIAYNTNGVLTYYFRIDPAVSDTVKGFWYVNQNGEGFIEHEVTDITRYDTGDTTKLVWFTVPKTTGKAVWLPPYYTENLDVRVISYNVPVYWEKQFVGVIGIEIDYEVLAREVRHIQIFNNGYAFIMDEDSNVIYHPQTDSKRLELETTALADTERYVGTNHVQYTFEGEEKEAVWIPLRNGMRLYVAAPSAEIDSAWRGMIYYIVVTSVLILLVSALVILQFTGSFTRPLRELTAAAKQVENGNYEFDLDYDEDDEVGLLTRTFKELAAHTREHISDLNERLFVDALTSVRNKAGFAAYIQTLQDQMDGGTAEPMEFAIGVFDCDDLKRVNDTYGHDKGDIYLKVASRLICKVFQHSPVFRIGGDEFAVVLQNDDYQHRDELIAQFRAERKEICDNVQNEWEKANVTMGLAVYDPKGDPSVIDVARRADRRMYENKHVRKEGS